MADSLEFSSAGDVAIGVNSAIMDRALLRASSASRSRAAKRLVAACMARDLVTDAGQWQASTLACLPAAAA